MHVHRHSSLRLRRYQREAASRCFRTTSMMTSLAKPGATSPKEDEGDGDDDGSDDDSN